ncbi:MAG TPA: CAP domain-containing protein, partial [Tepidisphaeraceae bacterium]|nr:CAP domain-containing protein [Tepidisphaeraceae bacterium]
MPKVVDRKRIIRAAVEGLESRVLLSTYLVTTNADSGPGSLRQAITDSNSSGNASNEIDFAIGTGGQQVILLQSPLPAITTSVNINGRTQAGYAGTPLVQINGYGLSISAGSSTVQGLDIVSTNSGALITLARFGGNAIAGNYLGVDLTGTTAIGNAQFGIYNNNTGNNLIGGTTPSQRNVISGANALPHNSTNNGSVGIYSFGLNATQNQIEGNYIGTNAAGTAAIPNTIGVEFDNQATFNTLGGTAAGAGNVVSGNSFDDVLIQNAARNNNAYGNIVGLNAAGTAAISTTANNAGFDITYSTGNVIGGSGAAGRNIVGGHVYGVYFYGFFSYQGGFNSAVGNYIGTDITGTSAVPNTYGLVINSYNDTVGGSGAQDRNIIAGNQVGLQIFQPQDLVEGNYIGLGATGRPLGNFGNGVLLSASGATVGGTSTGAGNVISANGNGIVVTASGGIIQGNLIGTDPTGMTDMGNTASGIFVSSQGNTTIGGTTTLARNVIAANKVNGVRISGDATTTGNVVQGNYIGVNAAGATLGNALAGVSIQGAAGTTVSTNTIGGNYGNGVEVIGASATNDKITQNSIYSNVGTGIDLGGDGATPNHVGGNVSGPDNLLNHPILTALSISPTATTVTGSLNAAASSAFTLEFFANPYGTGAFQGKTYLAKTSVNTDANGNATFTATLPVMAAGQTVTATTTDSSGDTSEFSPAIGVAGIVGRRIFYNDSALDGINTAISSADDQAIATDKQALLPGATAAFANYTSYSKGINGIMIDVSGLTGTATASDFTFLAGNSATPSQWSSAPAPASVQVRPGAGAGGASRIEVTWADGAIKNEWLQVTLNPTANTGLGTPDVFYFGNLVGETGKPPVNNQFAVTSADMTSARNDPHTFMNPASITDVNDFNRDGRVDAIDQLIARADGGATLAVLQPAATPLVASAATSAPVQPAQTSGAFPTAQEQYMLELINRARANPSGEAALDGINLNDGLPPGTIPTTTVQPLAFNPALTQAAEQHSQWMLANQTVSHNEGTVDPATRMQNAGYVFNSPSGSAENLAFDARTGVLVPNPTIVQEEQNLFVDSSDPNRSHRLNLLNPNFTDVGLGISTGPYGQFNAMYATQDFAYSAGSGPYLTGVVFNDSRIHDNFYTPGEGLGGVTITATRVSDGATFSTTTWAAGGYTLAVPAGTYAVTASGTGIASAITQQNVVIGTQNVEQDFNTSGPSYVAGRYVFYNDSAFDGNNLATNAADDNAIATDKQALLPGTPASFVNYTSYSNGINGIMVDLAGVPAGATLSRSDFTFMVGTTGTAWTAAPAPTGFLVRPGAGVGGSTRVEFTFANGAIRNEWLQITVAADANTGLAAPDVFYFGNAIAESGDNPANATVDPTDLLAARSDPHSFLNPA